MSTHVTVRAVEGRKVPLEGAPKRYFPAHDEKAIDVPRTTYVERLLADGDLVESDAGDVPAAKTTKKGAEHGQP